MVKIIHPGNNQGPQFGEILCRKQWKTNLSDRNRKAGPHRDILLVFEIEPFAIVTKQNIAWSPSLVRDNLDVPSAQQACRVGEPQKHGSELTPCTEVYLGLFHEDEGLAKGTLETACRRPMAAAIMEITEIRHGEHCRQQDAPKPDHGNTATTQTCEKNLFTKISNSIFRLIFPEHSEN